LLERGARPFIESRDLAHAYPLEGGGEVRALRGIDLTINRGEFVALVGPNGSGKSTLARHLNGLLLPTAGQVWVDGLLTADPSNRWAIRERVGMVFQNPDNQFVASTVEEDVAFGPGNLGLPPDEVRRRVDDALHRVAMADYATHHPHMLSGGQKQRVAIAGALATRPASIVLDEPTSMLDPVGGRQIVDTIRDLNTEEGITVVLITQSMDEATAAGRVLVMYQGRVVSSGTPAEVFGQGRQLREWGLGLPSALEIADRLRECGLNLPAGMLTVEQLASALC
jgi:energy-coupling factor transport system ATP-binding protein